MRHMATYVGLLHRSEQTLADSFRAVGDGHSAEADVFHTCETLAKMSEEHVRLLAPIAERYGEEHGGDDVEEPERLHAHGLAEVRTGAGAPARPAGPARPRHALPDDVDRRPPGGAGPARPGTHHRRGEGQQQHVTTARMAQHPDEAGGPAGAAGRAMTRSALSLG